MSIKALHRAYFVPKSQILVVSPTERQSGELVIPAQPPRLTASMPLIDEASVDRDEVHGAVRPMLAATDGELWLMSTPNGMSGFFSSRTM